MGSWARAPTPAQRGTAARLSSSTSWCAALNVAALLGAKGWVLFGGPVLPAVDKEAAAWVLLAHWQAGGLAGWCTAGLLTASSWVVGGGCRWSSWFTAGQAGVQLGCALQLLVAAAGGAAC